MRENRSILLALLAAMSNVLAVFQPALAKVIPAPRLPAWETVGTEVSTNISLVTHRSDVHKFSVMMDLIGTVSNCVQMAFGMDANGDGDLELEESDLLVGWRAGLYFIEDSAAGTRYEEPIVASAATMRTFTLHVDTDPGLVPRAAYASDNTGMHYFSDVLDSRPSWLFKPEWNMCKVTRRGMDEPQEWCRAEKSFGYFYLRVR